MTSILTLKKAILSAAVLTVGMVFAAPTQAQLVPEGPGRNAPAISCRIVEVRQEHNVVVNGAAGIKFHFKIEIDNAKGQKIRPTVFFFNKNDKVLKAIDPKYGNAANEMMATYEFSPLYDQTDYEGWVFMPYTAIASPDTPAGDYVIKTLYSVYHVEGQKFICSPLRSEFTLKVGAPANNDGGLVR